MDLPYDERDRIGLTLDVTEHEYQKIAESWQFELPPEYKMPVEVVMQCRYVAFSIEGRWHSIASINEWRVRLGVGTRLAELSAISDKVNLLTNEIRSNISSNKWLNSSQKSAVHAALGDNAILDKSVIFRPKVIMPCLDLDEAASSVARRYGVKSSQIKISIHRHQSLGDQISNTGMKEPESGDDAT